MSKSVDQWAEELRIAMEEWAHAQAEAELLDEKRKSIRSMITLHSSEKTQGRAEHEAQASPEYQEAVTAAIKAKEHAEVLKAKWKAMEVRIELMRTREATRRAEMKNLNMNT